MKGRSGGVGALQPWDALAARVVRDRHDGLAIAVVYNVPIACNRATADFMLSSPLLDVDLAVLPA
jgi:methylglyoxal synthase